MKKTDSKTLVAIVALAASANVLAITSDLYAQGVTPIKVVQWNVEDGEQPGEIDAIVAQQPDIVFLQEVDRPVEHLNAIVAALEADQSVEWDVPRYISRHNSMSGASWVAILSRFPMSNIQTTSLGYAGENLCGTTSTADRAAIGATIVVDGRPLAIFSTRNFWYSGDCPAQIQNGRLKTWAQAEYPNLAHLYGGDFNHNPGGAAYDVMTEEAPTSLDAWAEAVNDGTATAWDGTATFYTATKGNRIDYLFYKNAATVLDVTSAQIPPGNLALSDHRMMIATFTVGSGAPPPPPPPGDEPIVDNFDDSSLDTTLWVRDNVFSGSTNTSIPVNQVNQRLEIGPIPLSTTGYNGIRTNPKPFSGRYAQVQLVQAPASNTGAYAMFTIGDSDTHYRFWVQGTTLTCEEKVNNGPKAYPCSLTYNASAHQFLRISHDAATGQVVWQAAPLSGSGPGQWVGLGSSTWNTTYLPIGSVMFEVKAGTSTPETTSPGTVAFDSFAVGTVASTEFVILEDEFDDNNLAQDWIPSSIFSGATDSTIPVNEANQRLEVGPLPTNDPGYNGVRTSARDMSNGYAQVRLVQAPSSSTGAYAMLTIGDSDTHYRFWVQGTTLTCEEKINNAPKTFPCSLTYNATAHRYLRISHNAATGGVLFEAAPANGTGPGQWVPLGSSTWNTTYLPTTAVMFELKAGSSSSETIAPGTVAFDSFKAARRQ